MISTSGYPDPTEDSNAMFSSKGYRAPKTHDYTGYQQGVDYYFEFNHLEARAYMTGRGRGVKQNDRIILQLESVTQSYQVELIDYYSNPSDLWIALLKPID
jgi:hypothetical protein